MGTAMFSCPLFLPHALQRSTVTHFDQCDAESVPGVCGELHHRDSGTDDLVQGCHGGDWVARRSHLLEPACLCQTHFRLREHGIGWAENQLIAQDVDPVR